MENVGVMRMTGMSYIRCSDDELSCKICLAVYSHRSFRQRPRTLQCHHTFCESCLQQIFTEGQRKGKAKRSVSRPTVKCPLCKYRTSLGPTSIQGLPLNPKAIKHSAEIASWRGQLSRQLLDIPPRSANRNVRAKEKRNTHFMSSGTSGNRVTPQRFENFHPPPREDDDIWATLSNRRTLRFAKNDPSSRDIEHGSYSSYSPRDDLEEIPEEHMSDDAFDLTPSAVYMGQFGQQEEAPDGRPGTFRSPSSIDCAGDGRSAVVDADDGRVHIFARNGDCLAGFRVAGARAACFIKDAVRGESLAVVTNSGVSVCDQTGVVEKHLPIGGDVVAVAPLRYGGSVFAAAHRNRLTICDRYKPSAVLRSVSSARLMSAPIGHPGVQFTDIVGLATTATPRLYVVDSASILAVDIDTGTLLQSISPADTRLLRQPCAVDIDLVTGSIFVCDSTTQRVMQFDAGGAVQCCVADLADDGGVCEALAVGPRGPDGHQMVYVVYRRRGSGEVRMYQI